MTKPKANPEPKAARPEPLPPPPPTTWRVVINQRPCEVTAIYAKISSRGVLVFTDASGNLVKAFSADTWSAVESTGDPFANPIIHEADA